MSFKVLLTHDAARDLEDLYAFIAEHDSPLAANHVLDSIEKVAAQLAEFPHRGSHPKELLAVGITEYREVFFKPYRIIYRVTEKLVHIYLIADGRRDMQTLLGRRLLGD